MTRQDLLQSLLAILPADAVLHRPEELAVYDCDAYTLEKGAPTAVVLPRSAEEVAAVARLAAAHGLPLIARGAGTGLSGGATASEGGIVVALTRLNRILALDLDNRRALVESGVVNLQLTRSVAADGFMFAPDPSSQSASTIGGNVAENSGGPHTLKYGVTVNHVLGLEVVLSDGEIVWLGGLTEDAPGYDLLGLAVGSEGTFGIVTKALVRLTPQPESVRTQLAVFPTVDAACRAVSELIAAGVVPAALELIDQVILQAVEAAFHFGFPLDAGAVLIIELDGLEAGLDALNARVVDICQLAGAREVRVASDAAERARLWQARKKATGALGRLAPSLVAMDGVIPRTKLPEVLRAIADISSRHQLPIGNLFHAGDGNLHPGILFDERDPDQVARVVQAGREIMEICVAAGGSLTGEHGIGIEKRGFMSLMFTPADLALMGEIRQVFDPDNRLNPGKVLPTGKGCGEMGVFRKGLMC